MILQRTALVALAAYLAMAGSVFAQDQYIAGTEPSVRPQNAPVITTTDKTDQWYATALTGVSEPYPPNLGLDAQGAWYTPFNKPGMTGPYDIRNWHQPPPTQ